jgi:hypothetical protein
VNRKHLSDRGHIVQWLPYFEQSQCRRCGAWLEELPARAIDRGHNHWDLIWTCVRCGLDHRESSHQPADAFRRDPSVQISPPGTLPSWSDWRLPAPLISQIHNVADTYAPPANRTDLGKLPSVMDHTGKRQTPWGLFEGDADDPHGVRLQLARLRHTPSGTPETSLACVIAERAVLATGAVFYELRAVQLQMASFVDFKPAGGSELGWILDVPPVSIEDVEGGERAAPVIGWGRLTIPNRYEDWLLSYGPQPWFNGPHGEIRRGDIPAQTQLLAEAIELADSLLIAFHLFKNVDSFSELKNDFTRIRHLMERWRWFLKGDSPKEPGGTRRRIKWPNPSWRDQWEV